MGVVHTKAAETMQDGLEFTLTTDKSEYKSGEAIGINLGIQNNSGKDIKNISIEGVIPEDYVAGEGYDFKETIDMLVAGRSSSFETKYIVKEPEATQTPAATDSSVPGGNQGMDDSSDSDSGDESVENAESSSVYGMEDVVTFSVGSAHIGAVTSDGSLWMWGI